jgi:hypothetical protein
VPQGFDEAHDSEFLGIGPALAPGCKHLRAGDAFEHGVRYSLPDGRNQASTKQVARRFASNQSDAQRHGFSG